MGCTRVNAGLKSVCFGEEEVATVVICTARNLERDVLVLGVGGI